MPQNLNQDLYEAIIAAFTLVAFADGDVHTSEMSRLTKILSGEIKFTKITPEQLFDDVADARRRLDADFGKGKKTALSLITQFKDDAAHRDLILKVSRLASISDGQILEAEETILAEIHSALGVTE